MTERRNVLIAIGLLVPTAAAAHLPPSATGPHGGQVQVLGPYPGEPIAEDGELTLLLFSHRDRPLDARQASGTGAVLAEGRQQSVVLAPLADGATLAVAGGFQATPGLRVVVQIVPAPGAAQAQTRFTPAGLPR